MPTSAAPPPNDVAVSSVGSRPPAEFGPTGADVLAAGAVLWRAPAGTNDAVGAVAAGSSQVEIALVHRPRYDDWSFPKGKLDADESMPAAAVREVAEETGFVARLGFELGEVRYPVPEGSKVVRYWTAQARDGRFTSNAETDELRWVRPDTAAGLLTYAHDVAVLRRFITIGLPTALVILVRHAKAGSRHQWDGTDDLRPLSGAGSEQAAQLAELLVLFGPDRVATAPPVRCRDTVAPLAARLGLPLGEEELLGEYGYRANPAAGIARLRALASDLGVTVVCSQGGVIPDMVGELTVASGSPHLDVDPHDVPSRKASIWVLGLRAGELRTADYYPRPPG